MDRTSPRTRTSPAPTGPLDAKTVLSSLNAAALDAITAGDPGRAAGLQQAQTIVRRHAGLPDTDH